MDALPTSTALRQIPKELEPLFWSYRPEALDVLRDRRVITMQTINYGTWAQWQWLARTYGKSGIGETLGALPSTALRPGAQMLASLVFGSK